MKVIFPRFALLFIAVTSMAQPEDYVRHIDQAEALHQKGDYLASAKAYSLAFKTLGWKGYESDRYNAAKAWSLAGVPDSAFLNLFRIAEKLHYSNLSELQTEAAFSGLYALPQWSELCAIVKSNQPSMPDLAEELAQILIKDQRYRQMIDSVAQNFGHQSPEMSALFSIMTNTDAANTARVTEILDDHGWLGRRAVGESGNSALFLVIQHADIHVQEKYLPMMREAVKNGNARGADLALLEDRILMRNGKKQVYGSQVRTDSPSGEPYFFPIEDVDHVDERRAAVGLGPLAEYATYFGIVWDAAAIEKNRNMAPD